MDIRDSLHLIFALGDLNFIPAKFAKEPENGKQNVLLHC